MTEKYTTAEDKRSILAKSKSKAEEPAQPASGEMTSIAKLQHQIGNRAVQRLLVQRSGDGPFQLDDNTEARINGERGSGHPLDSAVQAKMSESTGHDFSDVRVHISPESNVLNEQLSAKAFTTGSDIFFREGAYDPNSGSGQELLAHELTHVVQQSSGAVGSNNGRMTVNAPGDSFEQEADSVAKSVMSAGTTPNVQMQVPEDDQLLQRQELVDDDEELNVRRS